jgi:DNA-binding IclR family transcriptional regulator
MKTEKRVTEERWMTAAELAVALDLTPARISQLTAEGILERRKDKHYDLGLAIACYGRFILAPHLFDDRRR